MVSLASLLVLPDWRNTLIRNGWWADHEYHRRKVEDVEEFIGWSFLEEMTQKVEAKHGFEKSALIPFLMEGGFRIGEAVQSSDGKVTGGLQKSMLSLSGDFVVFKRCLRLKGYKKTGTYFETHSEEELPDNSLKRLYIKDERSGLWIRKRFKTEAVKQLRSFAFPKDEPLVKSMLQWWQECPKETLFPFTATRAYQIFTGIDKSVWNHWFRSQRASQLAAEYNFNRDKLQRFFEWKDEKTARRYARLGIGDVIEMFPKAGEFSRILSR